MNDIVITHHEGPLPPDLQAQVDALFAEEEEDDSNTVYGTAHCELEWVFEPTIHWKDGDEEGRGSPAGG